MENFDWQGLIGAFLVLVAIGFGTERGTEILKALTRLIGAKWLKWEGLKGYLSFIAAAALVFAGIFLTDTNPLSFIEGLGFEFLDADLAKTLSALIALFIGNKIHDKGK
jgi:sulfite exporter TauE/SafE